MIRPGAALLLIFSFCLVAQAAGVAPPKPFGTVPSQAHLAWHDLEYYGFIHFTMTVRQDGLVHGAQPERNQGAC